MPQLSSKAENSTLPPELTPERVITDYLRFLSDHGFKKLAEQWGSFKRDDVTVVLSVPAAWSDSAKQTMRKAAFDAGLVQAADSRFARATNCSDCLAMHGTRLCICLSCVGLNMLAVKPVRR